MLGVYILISFIPHNQKAKADISRSIYQMETVDYQYVASK